MEESFTSLLYSPLPLRYELEIESKARNEKWEQYLIWLDKMKREEVSRKEELKKKEKERSYFEDILVLSGLDSGTENLKAVDARLLEMEIFETSLVAPNKKKANRKQQTKKVTQDVKMENKPMKEVNMKDRRVSISDSPSLGHSKLKEDLFNTSTPKRRGRPPKKHLQEITPISSSLDSASGQSLPTGEDTSYSTSIIPSKSAALLNYSQKSAANDEDARAEYTYSSPVSSPIHSSSDSVDQTPYTTPSSFKWSPWSTLPPTPRLHFENLTRIPPSPSSSPSKQSKEDQRAPEKVKITMTDQDKSENESEEEMSTEKEEGNNLKKNVKKQNHHVGDDFTFSLDLFKQDALGLRKRRRT